MQQALNDAAKAMSTVPTCTARAEEIARAWQTGHAFILGKLNEPVSMAELDSCKTGADQAIADAAVDALKDKSPLSAPDNARAAAQALDLLAAPLARLQAMNSALGWMAQARSWYSMPPPMSLPPPPPPLTGWCRRWTAWTRKPAFSAIRRP